MRGDTPLAREQRYQIHALFQTGQLQTHIARRVRGFKPLPKVIEGIQFIDGMDPNTMNSAAA